MTIKNSLLMANGKIVVPCKFPMGSLTSIMVNEPQYIVRIKKKKKKSSMELWKGPKCRRYLGWKLIKWAEYYGSFEKIKRKSSGMSKNELTSMGVWVEASLNLAQLKSDQIQTEIELKIFKLSQALSFSTWVRPSSITPLM